MLLAAPLALAGCFDTTTDPSGYRGPVTYSLEPDGVHCDHADEITEAQKKPCFRTECIWYCAEFQGKAERWVSIDFQHCGDGWEVVGKFSQNGICY